MKYAQPSLGLAPRSLATRPTYWLLCTMGYTTRLLAAETLWATPPAYWLLKHYGLLLLIDADRNFKHFTADLQKNYSVRAAFDGGLLSEPMMYGLAYPSLADDVRPSLTEPSR